MPCEWTLHNISVAEEERSSCPDDLLPLYDEVIALAKTPESEEKAKAFFELRERVHAAVKEKEEKDGKLDLDHCGSAMFEIITVCLFKELRHTATVQAVMHDEFFTDPERPQ